MAKDVVQGLDALLYLLEQVDVADVANAHVVAAPERRRVRH